MNIDIDVLLYDYKFWGIILFLFFIFALIFRKKISKVCSIKTSMLSLLIPFFVVEGFLCALNCVIIDEYNDNPISLEYFRFEYISCLAVSIISLLVILAGIGFYIVLRKRNFKIVGIILDFLLNVISFPFFVTLCLEFCKF